MYRRSLWGREGRRKRRRRRRFDPRLRCSRLTPWGCVGGRRRRSALGKLGLGALGLAGFVLLLTGALGLASVFHLPQILEGSVLAAQSPAGEDTAGEPGDSGDKTPLLVRPLSMPPDLCAGPWEARTGPLRIVLDPGHGGEDEGCSGNALQEKDVNLQIALLLEEELTEMGFETVMTRREDVFCSPQDRVRTAAGAQGDLYISIHQNSVEKGGQAGGIETWYCADEDGDSRRLARLVQGQTAESTGARDRGLQETDELYVLRECGMSACLVETGFLSNDQEEELLGTQEYCRQIADGIARGVDLYAHPKTMYLTFDDGPSAENTAAVLDILKERGIKATFFVVGENVRKNPELARRIVAEGHTIGIHCDCHDYGKIYESVEAYLADFQAAWDTVKEVTGVEAKLFRFPGGSVNSYNKEVYREIIEEMTEKGFVYFDWNASLEDAVKKTDPEQLLKNARDTTLGRKKVVMLAHDIVYNTTLCLEELIDQFPEYEMKPLTGEVAPIQFKLD